MGDAPTTPADDRHAGVPQEVRPRAPLTVIAREWGRIGVVGFGGPPAHISLLRELCVKRREWMDPEDFERAIAATSLLPGPSSTQLAIYCAWRMGGIPGALLGGVCFIAPAVVIILLLSLAFLSSSPPTWLRGAGAGAGAAVAAVAVHAGAGLAPPIWKRAHGRDRARVIAYAIAGAAATAAIGPWLVVVLLACGLAELTARRLTTGRAELHAWPLLVGAAPAVGGFAALTWTAFKVGALAFGGGFVIIPLMQGDAVHTYHWMTDGQFLNAVALGQVTPGPVVATIAAVGYAAHGIAGGLLAALVAFTPSFSFILIGAKRFERLIADDRAQGFLAGAAPAAIGAIVGSAIPLTRALDETWQLAVLAGAAILLFGLRRGVVSTLLAAGAAGTLAALLGASVPR